MESESEKQPIDYNKEVKDVEEKSTFEYNWWKAKEMKEGTHILKFCEEPTVFMKKQDKYEKGVKVLNPDNSAQQEFVKCVELLFVTNGIKWKWQPALGGKGSFAGQLMIVGENRGALKDTEIQVMIKKKGDKNDYTIMEYMELLNKEQSQVKESIGVTQ